MSSTAETLPEGRLRERTIVLCLLLAVVVHAAVMVRDVSGPLVAAGDANYFEFLGYFVRDHIRFAPLPTIDFVTDEVGYPFGTSVVYLSWCAERDLLHAALLSLFGPGPWLQLYVGASDILAALGTYVLLRREVGPLRAALVAFAATVMAFYAAFKFPVHLNMATLHWATMSIVVDFVIARRVVSGKRLDALLVLIRVALIGLTVGLDIAYVAGYALVSFTVTTLFLLGWIWRKRASGVTLASVLPTGVAAEMKRRPLAFAPWIALLAVACFLYVPFDFAVVKGSRIYDFHGPGGNFWASQLRLLIPYVPFLHPGSSVVQRIFGDADAVGEFSTGWALLVAAVLGVRDAWKNKRLTVFVPILVTFVLCFAFHPTRLRTLHVFPWFMYNRVAGRSTIFFPLLAALLALGIDTPNTRRSPSVRYVLGGLGVLALLETITAYALVHTYRPYRIDTSFRDYMAFVRAAPGTAVLDWPFCIAGANGVGTEELCPYYTRASTSYSYRRFHEKKVPGHYLSRLHEVQTTPWIRQGWPAMFSPDVPDAHRATHQTRCFDERDWAFFSRFYEAGDFSGIQLFADLEAPACLEGFYERFGRPAKETTLPGVGRVQFLPRAPGSRSGADVARARSVVR